MARMTIQLYTRLCCSETRGNLEVFRDNHLSGLQKKTTYTGEMREGGREGGRMPFLNLESIPVYFCLPVGEREAQ